MDKANLWLSDMPGSLQQHFDDFSRYLAAVNDGTMDMDRFLDSSYGAELGRRLALRCRIQKDFAVAQEYYRSIGLGCEFHQPDDYYMRWKWFYPLDYDQDQRYPVMIWNHGGGNSIESEEVMTGYVQMAAEEKFFILMAQNTNPDNNLHLLDEIGKRYPVDTGRVYVAGFSQGANQGYGLYTHFPERIAAAALTCIDIWRPWDNFDEYYTEQELSRLQASPVPLSLQVGACEPFAYAPLNTWHRNRLNPNAPAMRGRPDDFEHPGKIDEFDPTRITAPGKGRIDPARPGTARMTSAYVPGENEDVRRWSMQRVNHRLCLLDCPSLDVDRCISYTDEKTDVLHHITGIYGDEEETVSLYGLNHYVVRINSRSGRLAFQYVVTENSPHWPPITSAEIGWKFLKQFRK